MQNNKLNAVLELILKRLNSLQHILSSLLWGYASCCTYYQGLLVIFTTLNTT
jgi:hypothetical protein